jgi:hypothetical protein
MPDAQAACALYITKNDINKGFIFRHIEQRMNELLAMENLDTPIELLAKTQALILYQIIRFFDGDVRTFAVE